MARTRRGTRTRGGWWQGIKKRETQAQKINRRQGTPGGLLAGDSGQIVLVQSTLSHLSYRHPHAYGRYETVSPPVVALPF